MRSVSRAILLFVAIAQRRPFQVVESRIKPLQRDGLKTRPHDAESVADTRPHLAIKAAISHRTDGLC